MDAIWQLICYGIAKNKETEAIHYNLHQHINEIMKWTQRKFLHTTNYWLLVYASPITMHHMFCLKVGKKRAAGADGPGEGSDHLEVN